ncbi:Flagellar biosynthetic protein FliR [Gammaproteobacteria bacterium]
MTSSLLSDDQIASWVEAVFLPLFRVASLLMTAPVMGTKTIPARVRIGFAVVITAVIVPTLPPPQPINPLSLDAILSVLNQVLIGSAMGFTLRLVFAAVELGGQMVGQLMGLGFASLLDPQNGVPVPIVSQFYSLLVTLVYLSLNGHLLSLEALAESFRSLPIGVIGPAPETWWDVTVWAGVILRGGLLIALPAVGVLMLINLSFAVVTRAAPALNIFSVGFPITLGVGILIIIYTLPILAGQMDGLLQASLEVVHGLPIPTRK